MIKISGPLLQKYDSESSLARDLNSITEKLAKKDPTLWGQAATAEAAIRLNWIDLPKSSISLIPQLEKLKKSNPKIIYSSYKEAGEGEHKIIQYIKTTYQNKKLSHVIYGLDADLIMLSLLNKYSSKIILLRDNQNKNSEKDDTFTCLISLKILGISLMLVLTSTLKLPSPS